MLIVLILAVICLIFAYVQFAFSMWFWIILAFWLVVLAIKFFVEMTHVVWIAIALAILGTLLITLNPSLKSKIPGFGNKTDDVVLTDCTSTASDAPIMLDGWKSTIYSAPMKDGSASVSEANNVRTFSYDGIKNKTEANSMYVRVEKNDGSNITGNTIIIEVCDANNKTDQFYTTKSSNQAAGDNVVASESYLHGGQYLHGAGTYRIDSYVKTTDSKWHLINRLSDITITE